MNPGFLGHGVWQANDCIVRNTNDAADAGWESCAAMTLWWAGHAEKAPGTVALERLEPARGKCFKTCVCAVEAGLKIFWFMSRKVTW